MEDAERMFTARGIAVDCIGDSRTRRNAGARVTLCVYDSAHKVDIRRYTRVFIDEAHFVRPPAMYTEYEEIVADPDAESSRGYSTVRRAMQLRTARLFSATLDVPADAPRCTRTLREMIAARYICDFTLNVHVSEPGSMDDALARYIVENYDSMLVFAPTRAIGTAFCATMNALSRNGDIARYIDCDTPREVRAETIEAFRTGRLLHLINVRVLTNGFDAPITKGVCFLHMPASKTHIVQVVGRCLRLHPSKRMAVVLLPLATAESGAERARDFMRVLAQVDTRFALAMHRGGAGYIDVTGGDVHAAATMRDEIREIRMVYGFWDAKLAALVAYYEEHQRMPPRSGPYKWLGIWIRNQRFYQDTMTVDRRERLESYEWWSWGSRKDPNDDAWRRTHAELARHVAERIEIPITLARWATAQRKCRYTMSADRRARLESHDWWIWDTMRDVAWRAQYDAYVRHFDEHGGAMSSFWVYDQRQNRRTMPTGRVALLESLPYWKWDGRPGRPAR